MASSRDKIVPPKITVEESDGSAGPTAKFPALRASGAKGVTRTPDEPRPRRQTPLTLPAPADYDPKQGAGASAVAMHVRPASGAKSTEDQPTQPPPFEVEPDASVPEVLLGPSGEFDFGGLEGESAPSERKPGRGSLSAPRLPASIPDLEFTAPIEAQLPPAPAPAMRSAARPLGGPPPLPRAAPPSLPAAPAVPADGSEEFDFSAREPSAPSGPPEESGVQALGPAAAPDPHRELGDRFALGDFSGALVLAEAILGDRPGDPEATRVAGECRLRLEQMYLSRVGALTQVPTVIVAPGELQWLSLDHRSGFLLSLVDGMLSVEEILDVAAMPRLEVLRTLHELLAQRVIELRGR